MKYFYLSKSFWSSSKAPYFNQTPILPRFLRSASSYCLLFFNLFKVIQRSQNSLLEFLKFLRVRDLLFWRHKFSILSLHSFSKNLLCGNLNWCRSLYIVLENKMFTNLPYFSHELFLGRLLTSLLRSLLFLLVLPFADDKMKL
jgi:hypothetical protein